MLRFDEDGNTAPPSCGRTAKTVEKSRKGLRSCWTSAGQRPKSVIGDAPSLRISQTAPGAPRAHVSRVCSVGQIATRMKILCIAPEQSDVLAVASTLPELSRGISLSWAERFEDAAFWIFHNRDLAALVLDAQFGHEPCAALLANLQKRGLRAPTIVVADQSSVTPNALGLGPDDCLLPRSTLARDLPAAIKGVVEQRQPAPPERHTLETKLARAEAALREANARHASEIRAASERLARLDSELRDALAREVSARQALEGALSRVERDRAEANAAHAVAVAELVTQLREQETRAEARLVQDEAATLSAQRERAAEERLAREVGLRRAADLELSRAEAAAREAAATHAAALAAAVEQIAERDARLEREQATAQAAHAALAQRLEAAERARDEAEQGRVRERHSAAEHLAEREQVLGRQIEGLSEQAQALRGQIAEAVAAREGLVQRLTDAGTALQAAHTQAAQDAATAAARAAERERKLEAAAATLAAHEAHQRGAQAALADVEARLQAAEQARRDADAVSARERLAAEAELTQLRAVLEAAREDGASAQRALEERLVSAVAASEGAKAMHAAAMSDAAEQAAAREQALNTQLADAVAEHVQFAREASTRERTLQASIAAEIDKRQAAERALDDSTRARDAAAAAHASELAAATDRLAQRQAELDAERLAAREARHVFEQQFERAAQTHREALARATEALAVEAARTTSLEADVDAALQLAEDQRGLLEAQIASLETASRDAARQHADAMAAVVAEADRHRQQLETRLAELTARLDALARELAEREAALRSHVEEKEALSSRLATSQQEATQAYDTLQMELGATIAVHVQEAATHAQEIERLRLDLTAAARDLATTRDERNVLEVEAGRTNQLLRDLDELRMETARECDRHPLPLLRCDRDGTVTQVNRAFAEMVGHASADGGQRLALATDLFRASNDLRWLVERSRIAGVVTQTESTLQARDGRCLVVRLLSSATPSGAQVVVQDLTPQRTAQRTLDQARRLEAVGRLGTEVAVTSSQLLRGVCRDIERWLSAFDGTRAMRRRVELLLDDVARAAGHLDRLTAFGEEQANVIPSVDLHRVLHDMAPVLREIAGDEVEILLPGSAEGSLSFEVDVEGDRVERLLVNVASYCRDRLLTGGSLRFELASTVVDRAFIEKYPAVRPGPHVVCTVAGVNGPIRLMGPAIRREELAVAHDDGPAPSGAVGVDLGGLQALVRGCHGHLWIDAAASGDLTIRIHLPLKVA